MFSCENKDLSEAVTWVAQSLHTRTGAPAYNSIRIRTMADDPATAVFSVVGQDTSASTTIGIESDGEPFDFLIAGPALTNYVRIAPVNKKTEFAFLDDDDTRISVRTGTFKTKIPILPAGVASLFPDLPEYAGTVSGKLFARGVHRTALAAAPEKTAIPVFAGIQMTLDADTHTLTMVATDRYRLAVSETPYTPIGSPEGDTGETVFVLPARLAEQYAKFFANTEAVSFGVGSEETQNAGVFVISDGEKTAVGRLLDGDYPKWRPIYDTVLASNDITVHLPTAEVQQASKRVAAMSDQNAPFTLVFRENELTLTSVMDGQTPTTDSVPVTYVGDEFTARYNHDYFVSGLAHTDGDVIYRSSYARNQAGDIVKEKRTPGVLTPADENKQGKFTYIIMPLAA